MTNQAPLRNDAPVMGRRYLDAYGVVHETRQPRMTILLCEERDGHRNYGTLVAGEELVDVPTTCLECLAAR